MDFDGNYSIRACLNGIDPGKNIGAVGRYFLNKVLIPGYSI